MYVYEDAGRIGWSTHLRTLLAAPGADLRPDPMGFAEQLAGTLRAGPRTLFANIRRLPPALPEAPPEAPSAAPAADLPRSFRDAVDERVARCVPAMGRPGLLLGGGLYSHLLAGALHRTGRAFDAAVLQTDASTDSAVAQAVGQACGTRTAVCPWGADEQAQADRKSVV